MNLNTHLLIDIKQNERIVQKKSISQKKMKKSIDKCTTIKKFKTKD